MGLVFLKAPLGPVWGPLWGIVLSCLTLLAWRLLSAWQGIAGPRLGSPFGLLLGVGIGAILTVCSVIAMGVVGGYPVELHPPSRFMLLNWPAQQVRAACLEETFVRGGTVHFLTSFFGPGWGYFCGSVPWALMHFCNGWFSWRCFVCIVSAGLMLSAVYLEYGLLAAIGVHYAWNALSCLSIDVLNWPVVGRWALEAEWTTTFVNLIATGAVVMVSRRRKPAGNAKPDEATSAESQAARNSARDPATTSGAPEN